MDKIKTCLLWGPHNLDLSNIGRDPSAWENRILGNHFSGKTNRRLKEEPEWKSPLD